MEERNHAQTMIQIQQLQFAALELNLFLDTHPDDQQVLAMYNHVHQQLIECVRAYEQVYGPLLNYGYSPALQNYWAWAENPWPWELKY